MPTISHFDGIDIVMYFNDHAPPHFHSFYKDHEALIEWNPPQIYRGSLPGKKLKTVLAWAALRAAELDANWALARRGMPVHLIAPPP
jgi:hypothetical protein